MVDPCFPCLLDRSLFTGQPKEKYDAWTDERLSWEEIERQQQELFDKFEQILKETPSLQERIRNLFS